MGREHRRVGGGAQARVDVLEVIAEVWEGYKSGLQEPCKQQELATAIAGLTHHSQDGEVRDLGDGWGEIVGKDI